MTRKQGAPRRKKGIATIVGITIFLALFSMMIAFTFLWEQNTHDYITAVSDRAAVDSASASESLQVDVINETFLTVTNPTSEVSVVNHVMSNYTVWNINTEIPPFGNATLGPFLSADGNFKVTTLKGNMYTGDIQSELAVDTNQAWNVTWYVGNSVPGYYPDFSGYQQIGVSYWYRLSMDWFYGTGSTVVGGYSFAPAQMLGFVATANLIKLTDNNSIATINYRIDNSSKIAFVIDGVPQDPLGTGNYWYDSSEYAWYTLSGPLYSYHTVTVYFYGYGYNSQQLSLNIVNATFVP